MIVVVEKTEQGKYVVDPEELNKALNQSYQDGYSEGYKAGSNYIHTPIVTYEPDWYKKYEVTCSTDDPLPGQISMEDIIYQGETYNE